MDWSNSSRFQRWFQPAQGSPDPQQSMDAWMWQCNHCGMRQGSSSQMMADQWSRDHWDWMQRNRPDSHRD